MRHSSLCVSLLLVVLAWLPARSALAGQAVETGWIDGFPSVETVLASLEGESPLDTRARRAYGFGRLIQFVQELLGTTSGRTSPDLGEDTRRIQKLIADYSRAKKELDAGVSATERPEYARLGSNYGMLSEAWLDELVTTLFTEEWQARWYRPDRAKIASEPDSDGTTSPYDREAQEKAGARKLMTIFLWCLPLMILAYWLGGRGESVRLGEPDPLDLQGTVQRLASSSGTVQGYNKHVETNVSARTRPRVGPVGGTAVTVSSTVVQQFFLVDEQGGQRSFQLVNWTIPIMDGQRASVVWGEPRGGKGRACGTVMVVNHDTGDRYSDRAAIRILIRPRATLVLWLIVAVTVLTCFSLLFVIAVGPALAAFWFARWRMLTRRVREFDSQCSPRIAEHLDAAVRR